MRFGRRLSRSLETIGVGEEAGDAPVDEAFLLRGVDWRLGVELSASEASLLSPSVFDNWLRFDASDLLRLIDCDSDRGGEESAQSAETCGAVELSE